MGFLLGIAAGGFAGWQNFAKSGDGNTVEQAATAEMQRSGGRADRGVWSEQEFLAEALTNAQSTFGSKARGVEKWSMAQLHAALEASLRDPDCVTDSFAGRDLRGILVNELIKRDPEGALAWLLSVKSEAARRRMYGDFDLYWPTADAERARAFFREHPELRGPTYHRLFNKALSVHAQDGPLALAEYLGKETGEWDYIRVEQESFPKDFDFATFLNTEAGKKLLDAKGGPRLVGQWMQQNGDQAFSHLLQHGMINQMIGAIRSGSVDREQSTLQLAARLDSLDPEMRAKIVTQMAELDPYTLRSAEELHALATGVSDPQLRSVIREAGLQLLFSGNAKESLAFLDDLPEPEQRLTTLENLTQNNPTWGRFTPEDDDVFRKKLRSWGAEEARIEAILHHIKHPFDKQPAPASSR